MAKLREQHILIGSFKAHEAVTAKTAVKLDTTNDPSEVVPCGANERGIGIALDSAEAGESLRVVLLGLTTGKRGSSAVTAGAALISDADGKMTPASTTPGDGTQNIIAYAVDAPGATNEEFPILVVPGTDTIEAAA